MGNVLSGFDAIWNFCFGNVLLGLCQDDWTPAFSPFSARRAPAPPVVELSTDDLPWISNLQCSDCSRQQCFSLAVKAELPSLLSASVTPPSQALVSLQEKKWINVSFREPHKAKCSFKHESDSCRDGHLQRLAKRTRGWESGTHQQGHQIWPVEKHRLNHMQAASDSPHVDVFWKSDACMWTCLLPDQPPPHPPWPYPPLDFPRRHPAEKTTGQQKCTKPALCWRTPPRVCRLFSQRKCRDPAKGRQKKIDFSLQNIHKHIYKIVFCFETENAIMQ